MTKPLKIATWNINSVRLRIDQVTRFLTEQDVDVLCLQEIKCQEPEFPRKAFHAIGYTHIEISGQKGYHGAATVSKLPLERLNLRVRGKPAQHNLSPLRGQRMRNAKADPAGGSGHECSFSVEHENLLS